MSFQCPAQQQAETSHRQRQMDSEATDASASESTLARPLSSPGRCRGNVFIWSDGVIKFLKGMFVFLKRGCQNYISWFHPTITTTTTTKPASTTAHEAGIDEGIWSQPLYIRAEVRSIGVWDLLITWSCCCSHSSHTGQAHENILGYRSHFQIPNFLTSQLSHFNWFVPQFPELAYVDNNSTYLEGVVWR